MGSLSTAAILTTSILSALPAGQELDDAIHRIWNARKQYFVDLQTSGLGAHDPEALYNVEILTNNLIKYADFTHDVELLDSLAEVYLVAYDYLELRNTYWYYYVPGYDRESEHPLDPPARMWVDTIQFESLLCSSQFTYGVADLINAVAALPAAQRTPNMIDLAAKYASVLVTDHYQRWLTDDKVTQVTGWGCRPGVWNYLDFLTLKLQRQLNHTVSYCDAITDTDLWIVAGVVEVLAANARDPDLVPMTDQQKQLFTDFARVGCDLTQSRLAGTYLTDFSAAPVWGVGLDFGVWYDHPEYGCTGYSGETFPVAGDCVPAEGVGWDISHARRLVHVLDTLYVHRDVTGRSFPGDDVMTQMANQLSYRVFNKDFDRPLFNNFMDGTNGWYRVGYHGPDFGYGPSDLSVSFITGGYPLWSWYNPDVNLISDAMWGLIIASLMPDGSGHGNHGSLYGAQWTADGRLGGGLHFDGVDDYMDGGGRPDFATATGSIEFWFKADTLDGYDDLVNVFEDGYYNFLLIRRETNNKILLYIEDDDQAKVSLFSSRDISDTDWHHVAVVQNGFGAKIYLDGTDTTATGTNSAYWTGHLDVGLGGAWFGNGHWDPLAGSMDEIRVYNRPLSETEVYDHFAGQFSDETGLVAWWSFNDQPDQAAIDFFSEYYGSDYNLSNSMNLLQFLPSLIQSPSAPTPTPSPTATHTPQPTATPSATAGPSDTPAPTDTPADEPTSSPSPTPEGGETPMPSPTATATGAQAATATVTATGVATDGATPTADPIATATPTASSTAALPPTPTRTPWPTATSISPPTNTASPTGTATATATAEATLATDTPVPTSTSIERPTATLRATVTPSATSTPAVEPTQTPTSAAEIEIPVGGCCPLGAPALTSLVTAFVLFAGKRRRFVV